MVNSQNLDLSRSLVLSSSLCAAEQPEFDNLPVAVSNNAGRYGKEPRRLLLYTSWVLARKKNWDSVSNEAYVVNESGKWAQARSGAGSVGRLAAEQLGEEITFSYSAAM